MASTSAPSSTATEALLRCEGLGYRYGDGEVALQNVSLTLWPGSVTALVGDNGSGKSTLLKLCAGRLRPSQGVLRWQSKVTPAYEALGYAAQMPELDPEMTGIEHLTLMSALMAVPRALRPRRIANAIETWQLASFVADRVGRYSGGMRRRLHVALSRVHAPSLWLLDEPSAGLDPERQATLRREIRAHVTAGGAALIASHDLSALEELGCDVLRLMRGQRV